MNRSGHAQSSPNDPIKRVAQVMSHNVTIIESTNPDFPAALRHGALVTSCPRIWAIGNLDILKARLLGFFCSTKFPGNVIVQTYDLARALRHSSVPVIGGFQSPMEKECLDLLLRGQQPVVICPARSIEQLRLPTAWRTPLDEGRLLVFSPFTPPYRRPTAGLAEQRNCLVAALSDAILIAHASPGSKIEWLYAEIVASGKRVYTLDLPENVRLMQQGVKGYAVPNLVDCILGQ
jgi:predicted Rossmann fold nucleotide-binding protein DprA/Smf involved in DNA uptake